jgi:hypothetical protein
VLAQPPILAAWEAAKSMKNQLGSTEGSTVLAQPPIVEKVPPATAAKMETMKNPAQMMTM